MVLWAYTKALFLMFLPMVLGTFTVIYKYIFLSLTQFYLKLYSGAIKFASFELSKIFVEARTPIKFHPAVQFACAAGAMLACSVVLVPGEVLKTKLQGGVVTSLFGGIKQIIKSEGVGGLFAGYFATLVRYK